MAILIEAYGAESAIALSEKYSYNFLSLLLDQTAELRKDPEQRVEEDFQDWLAENKGRKIQVKTETGVKKINLRNFAL